MVADTHKVVIVGAGPAGLLLAHMLGQRKVQVDVLEALEVIDGRPRGAGYGPAAVQVLHRAGILPMIRERGLSPDSMTWRKLDGSIISQLSGLNNDQDRGGFVMYPVHDFAQLLLEEVNKFDGVRVYFGHKVTSVGQNHRSAWVECDNGAKFEGDFVVGCDGATSAVRKALFGREFPGTTWDPIIVATNVMYDFAKHGWADMSWVVDPVDWAVVAHLSQDGVWRVSYGETGGLSDDELAKRMPEKLKKILPGNPSRDEYEILRFNPYTMHQRCAKRMAVGRIALAADAAHLNNPMGGLGFTTGICDIGSLADCLTGIYEGKADLEILDRYDEVRRDIWNKVTDPISTINLERVQKRPEDVADGKDAFFAMLERAQTDPSVAQTLMEVDLSIGSDLTKYYKNVST